MSLPLTLTLPRTVTRTLTLTSWRPHPRGGLGVRRVRTLRDRTRYLLRQLLALRRLRQTHGLRTRRGEEWGDRRDRAQVAFDVPSRRGAGRRARAPHHCQWLGVCRFGHVASLRLWGGPFIHHDLLQCAVCRLLACAGETHGRRGPGGAPRPGPGRRTAETVIQ